MTVELPNAVSEAIQHSLLEGVINEINYDEFVEIQFYENIHQPNKKRIHIETSYNTFILEWNNPQTDVAFLKAAFYESSDKKDNTSYDVYTHYNLFVADRDWIPLFIAIEDRCQLPVFPEWWSVAQKDEEWAKHNYGENSGETMENSGKNILNQSVE